MQIIVAMDCIACLKDPGSMGNGLLIYMVAIKDVRQRNEANRAISIGKTTHWLSNNYYSSFADRCYWVPGFVIRVSCRVFIGL